MGGIIIPGGEQAAKPCIKYNINDVRQFEVSHYFIDKLINLRYEEYVYWEEVVR